MSARPVVVAHLSDLHLGAHDPAAVASVVADVAAARPALTVITGDSTMRARAGEFRQVRELIDRLPGPVLTVTGNHDLPLVSWRRLLRPYARFTRWIDADLDPARDVPGITALGLQSMPRWRWKNGRVTARQAAAVVRILGGSPAADVRVLALHHPPLATGTGRLIGRSRLLEAIRAARVDLVLAGHTHIPDVRVRGRQVFVVAGTAASRRTRGTPCSWSLIRVGPDEVVVRERYLHEGAWRVGRVVRARPGSAGAVSAAAS
ncbi:metallophosphoesterase [Actinoplanes sp. NEAU-A12]|uniref:Metallophosphoesterase n=1 Tax=Actinoplanes sandaracinus TaxID=3045177 RepID=A0ABT6WZT7_9ACTN|nr:metallophosphoesterase [Actinoplanes sandaracinus]MDI6105254.1 metallophosphoesterase [Actinoplanes sandaracinus]